MLASIGFNALHVKLNHATQHWCEIRLLKSHGRHAGPSGGGGGGGGGGGMSSSSSKASSSSSPFSDSALLVADEETGEEDIFGLMFRLRAFCTASM